MTGRSRIKLFVIIGVIIIIAFASWRLFIWTPSIQPEGSAVTEKELIHDLSAIGNRKLKIYQVRPFQFSSLSGGYDGELIDNGGRHLYLSGETRDNTKLNHVYSAMEMLMYINTRQMPEKIGGVIIHATRSWMIDGSQVIAISVGEFNELQRQVGNDGTYDEQIDALAEAWIKKHKYEGWFEPIENFMYKDDEAK